MRLYKRVSKPAGTAPGSLIHTGKNTGSIEISVIDYTNAAVAEHKVAKVEDCFKFKKKRSVTWIDVAGLHDVTNIAKLGEHYELHPLLLEDVLDVEQRPKSEPYEKHVFVTLKMLRYDQKTEDILAEQISIVFGKGHVITFQERPGDVFDPVRERIRKGKGKRIRTLGSDYLAYALIDVIVDNYFTCLEQFGDRLEKLEAELLDRPSEKILHEIQRIKRELLFLRKSVWPLRDAIGSLYRGEHHLISQEVTVFLRDVSDHTVQVIDTIETFRDMAGGLYDTYLSSVNNRMSEVMKVLTIIATIFIPLTFIAGIYGMNFDTQSAWNMPELAWQYGYPAVMLFMLVIGLGLVWFFRRRGWL